MAEIVTQHMNAGETQTDRTDKLPDIHVATHSEQGQQVPKQQSGDRGQVSLPDIRNGDNSSTDSLIQALGLVGTDEKSLGKLLKSMRGQVLSTLEELRTITTHDDNLERQYKEVLSENTQLTSALEKARGEIRHLKGQLSVLQMTSPEIRKHRARVQLRDRRRADHERQMQQSRSKYAEELIPLLNSAERARTVNARGEYIDHRRSIHPKRTAHSRHSTYPPPLTVTLGQKSDPLPPPLLGCNCSICNSKQSLGAHTMGPKHQQHVTKNGQQILLGDRVIIKGEKPGTVRYIGKLESDILGQLYIGIHLDMPVGTCDGSLKGRHYFQCPRNHGVFVRPGEVICVTGRKPCYGGTTIPRLQERLPSHMDISRGSTQETKFGKQELQSPTPFSSRTTSTMTHAHDIVESELAMAKDRLPDDLFDESVQEMSKRISALSGKNKPKPAVQDEPAKPVSHVKRAKPAKLPRPRSPPTPLGTVQQTTSWPPKQSPPSEASPERSPTPHSPLPTHSTPPITHSPSPPPRPPNPEPVSPTLPIDATLTEPVNTPPPERAATPLETTLLQALQSKDLGSTGFVTARELASILLQLPPGKPMTPEQSEEVLGQLGISISSSGGIPYHNVIPYLVEVIDGMQ